MFITTLVPVFSILCAFLGAVTTSPITDIPNPALSLTLPSPNDNTTLGNPHQYNIPDSQLALVFEARGEPIDPPDTLVLLMQSVFSATRKINAGGPSKYAPVRIFQHKFGSAQLQMVPANDRSNQLTAFKMAQIFNAMGALGVKIGFHRSQWAVFEKETLIAKLAIEG